MRSWKRMQQQTGWPWGPLSTLLYCAVPLLMIGLLLWGLPYARDAINRVGQ